MFYVQYKPSQSWTPMGTTRCLWGYVHINGSKACIVPIYTCDVMRLNYVTQRYLFDNGRVQLLNDL